MAITSIWPVLKDWFTNLPNRLDNRDYNLADDMNEVRQFMIQSEQLMGDFTYGGGIATMFATAQNTPIMNVRIGGGSVWFGGSKVEKFAGPYTSPTVTAPIGNPRIDVLTMNTSGVFAWTVGTPAGSPVAPAYPTGKLPICEIYVPVGATRIMSTVEEASGTDAYILNHRPIKPDMIVPGSGGHIFKDEGGAALTQRTYANFIGAHVTATDNSGADSTDITIDDLLTIASKSANYTATVDDRLLAFDCTSGNKTLTLYTASAHAGMWLYVIKTDVSVNTLTIDPNGAELINGAATIVLAYQFDAVLIYVNGTSWFVISKASATGGGHIIQDNGTNKTARGHLNIIGATVTDDAGNDATILDFSALGGGGGGVIKGMLPGHFFGSTVAGGGTTYSNFGNLDSGGPFNGTEAIYQFRVPMACTLKDLGVNQYNGQPAGGDYTLTIRKNGVDTALILTLPASQAAGFYVTSGLSAVFAAGDLLSIKLHNASGSTSAAIMSISVMVEVTSTGTSFKSIMCNNMLGTTLAGSASTFAGFFADGTYNTTETIMQIVMPFNCTLRNLSVRMHTGMPGGGSLDWIIRKNGVDTALVCSIPGAGGAGFFSDSTHHVDFVAGDLMCIRVLNNNAGTSGGPMGYSVEVASS